MKKLLCLIICFCMALSLISCAQNEQPEQQSDAQIVQPAQGKTTYEQHGSAPGGSGTGESQPEHGSAQQSGQHEPSAHSNDTNGSNGSNSSNNSGAAKQGSSAGNGNSGSAAAQQPETPAETSSAQTTKQPQSTNGQTTANPASQTITCTVSIDCNTAYEKDPELASAVSSSGSILNAQQVTLKTGATVYDALEATGVLFGGSASYVVSINSLAAGDVGGGSGWMYNINGIYGNVGCNKYTLKDGDKVSWRYTCDNGKDIGGKF